MILKVKVRLKKTKVERSILHCAAKRFLLLFKTKSAVRTLNRIIDFLPYQHQNPKSVKPIGHLGLYAVS